ncbi:MAG: C-GCAxxG-C-C family protein [Faecalibacterium sp.]|jgi:C_GCAxxG_C_C family probable redox protein|nr:C-GCAxxG-C-C family protein [Faecalibacterium sp.]
MGEFGEKAEQYFHAGYNCSQSVVAAFAPVLGISEALALRMSAGFGGGVGRMREVCGAFCGATTVLSLAYANPADPADKSRIYGMVQELAAQYRAQNGADSILCRTLLGLEKPEGSPQAAPRTSEYYQKRPCAQLVHLAADLTAEYLAAHPAKAVAACAEKRE